MTSHKIDRQKLDHFLSAYDYTLPEEFIASRPSEKRDESKLLVFDYKTGAITHTKFNHIGQFLPKQTVLVLNQSKVFPARLLGKKPTGGEAELFLLSLIHKDELYPVMLKCSGSKKIGDTYLFGTLVATLHHIDPQGSFWVRFNSDNLLEELEKKAHIPIPPYIRNGVADEQDKIQYQTVYAQDLGSVAAPTAGLHFTPELLESLAKAGIKQAKVTLHVGAGTFQPVKAEKIDEHKMHQEFYQVTPENAEMIKAGFGHLIPVGTTSMRTIQSCMKNGTWVTPKVGLHQTDIFLSPGKVVHGQAGLITNFHLPKSSLIMLVSSLIGREKTLELYEVAKRENYRFFSYGDAMLILL